MTIRPGIYILADTKCQTLAHTHTFACTLAHLIAHFGRMCATYMNSPWCKVFHQISKIIDSYFFHMVVVMLMLMLLLLVSILLRTLNGRNGAHKTKYKYVLYVRACACVSLHRQETEYSENWKWCSSVWQSSYGLAAWQLLGPKAQLYAALHGTQHKFA